MSSTINFNDETSEISDFDGNALAEEVYPDNIDEELENASISTAEKRRIKKYIAALTDDGMIQLTVRLPKTLGGTKVKVPVYESSLTPNHRIRDAVSGELTPYKVGSLDENLFFKVCWATGEGGRKSPSNLFFGSPGEYEKHLFERVSERLKQDWYARRAEHIRNDATRKVAGEASQVIIVK